MPVLKLNVSNVLGVTERVGSSYVTSSSSQFFTSQLFTSCMTRSIFLDACLSGSAASVTSTVALATCGEVEDGAAAGPINGPSQWLWGEHEAYTKEATWRHTVSGYVIHHAMSILWASVYESVCRSPEPKSLTRIVGEAAGVGALAYVVDYYVAPSRLRPGFRKHLGPRSIFAVYASFAAGLALATIVRQRERAAASLESCRFARKLHCVPLDSCR